MIQSIEGIIDIKVPLVDARDLSRAYGVNVSFLDASVYPSGTIKDLRNAQNLLDDKNLDEVVYVDISWGNSARSMATLANLEERVTGKRRIVVAVIPKGYKGLKDDLEKEGCVVIEKSIGELEKRIDNNELRGMVIRKLKKEGIKWSKNPSLIFNVEREEYYGVPYGSLSKRIPMSTDYVFVPFGSGEIAEGVINGLLSRYKNNLDKMPTIVCIETEGKNNLREKNLTHDKTLTKYITFKEHLERLSHWFKGKIEFMTVSEDERDKEYNLLQMLGINAEPASALAFAGARKYNFPSSNKNVVILNTGCGRIYQQKRSIYESLSMSRLARAAAILLIGVCIGGSIIHLGANEYQRRKTENETYVSVFCEAMQYAKRVGDKIRIDKYLVDPYEVLWKGKKPVPFNDLNRFNEREKYAHGGDGEIFRALEFIAAKNAGRVKL